MFSTTDIVPETVAESMAPSRAQFGIRQHSAAFRLGGKQNSIIIVRDGKEKEVDRSNCIILEELPASVSVKLKHLDLRGDGVLDVSDIVALNEKERAAVEGARNYRLLTWVVGIVLIFQLLATFAVTYGAVLHATPYTFDKSGRMTEKGSSSPVLVASSDTCIIDGTLVPRGADGSCSELTGALKTSSAVSSVPLSSDLGDDIFESLMTVNLISPTNFELQVQIEGFVRNAVDNSVKLLTPFGVILCKQTNYTVYDHPTETLFSNSGFKHGESIPFYSPSSSTTSQQRRSLYQVYVDQPLVQTNKKIAPPSSKTIESPRPTAAPTYKTTANPTDAPVLSPSQITAEPTFAPVVMAPPPPPPGGSSGIDDTSI
jgi:hypothetical protein